MKTTVWVVSTCIPNRGEKPCMPAVFGTEAEANLYADKMLRAEWAEHGIEDFETSERLPYPGTWRDANDLIAREIDDGSWGEWEITSHEIDVSAPPRPVVSVREMRLSPGEDGKPRSDFYCSIRVGGREVTPHMFRDRYKTEYHVALYDWLLNGGEEPDLMAFAENEWPARHSTIASPYRPHEIAQAMREVIQDGLDGGQRYPTDREIYGALHAQAFHLLDWDVAARKEAGEVVLVNGVPV